jgi:hypothetical protein
VADYPGTRLPDTLWGELPEDHRIRGSYWKYVNEAGEPVEPPDDPEYAGNLTHTTWGFTGPQGGVGTLRKHTVRENPDGTINVLPGDGSSNSIAFTSRGYYWHGYIYDGVWREV